MPQKLATRTTSEATRRRYVMCRPTYFDVTYSINPWMDPARPTSTRVALRQWQYLHDLYVDMGHEVHVLEPRPGLPDMVFAANGAISLGGRALVARFLHHQRAAEADAYLDWFRRHGWSDVRQSVVVNEGQGDFLLVGNEIFAGSGFRSEAGAQDEVLDFFGVKVIGLTLVDPRFYHLDTAFAVLGDSTVMYFPGAFSEESLELLGDRFPDAILVDEADAVEFGLNAVCDGRHVVLARQADRLAARLRERGYQPVGVDLSEFSKSGGGVKCCTLELHDQQLETTVA
jgi:N-dimethylarginine dimethylaminohydrolase